VSLSIATRSAHVPIDFELYLPESWTSDPLRRKECHIPDDLEFKTKEDPALLMIDAPLRTEFRAASYSAMAGMVDLIGSAARSEIMASTTRSASCRRKRRGGSTNSNGGFPTRRTRARLRRGSGTMAERRKLSSRFAFCRVKGWKR
jgi:hypothetical protein